MASCICHAERLDEEVTLEACPVCGGLRLARPVAAEASGGKSPLRSRRWSPGSRESKGHSAGADCVACGVACEPVFGEGYRCPTCGAVAPCCGDQYGLKACELLEGHDGHHESRSGTSWPQKSPIATSGPPLAYPSAEGDQLAASATAFRALARDLRQQAQLCLGAGQTVLLGLALRAETLAAATDRLLRDLEPRPSRALDALTLARESTHRPADPGPRPTYPPTGWGEG